jgi:hypothetical protein
MQNTPHPARMGSQLILYLLTLSALLFSGYLHLSFSAVGINNITLSDLINAWPLLILLPASLLLIVSILTVFGNSYQAAKLAILGGLIGLTYFAIAGCILIYLWFLPVRTMPNNLMFFAPSIVLLIITLGYSYQITESIDLNLH